MKKRTMLSVMIPALLLVTSCGFSRDTENPPATTSSVSNEPEVSPELPDSLKEYMAVAESYAAKEAFVQMDEVRIKSLSDLLLDHYEVIGRTAGGEKEYYLALRKQDAPVCQDIQGVDVASVTHTGGEEALQIGYYNGGESPVVLYSLEGYELLEMPLGYESLDAFCLTEKKDTKDARNQAFALGFTQKGRSQLDFINNKAGLSLYEEERDGIVFDYQDEDTLKFYSAPYPCFIAVSETERNELREMLLVSEEIKGINSRNDAMEYLHNTDASILPTGARLRIDGTEYELVGNVSVSGYFISTSRDGKFTGLSLNKELYRFVLDKIKDAVDRDYGAFDARWFEQPLASAGLSFPKPELESGPLPQTITDKEKLASLSLLMDQALKQKAPAGLYGCPYSAVLELLRADGETLTLFIAADSCGTIAYEGRMGFVYGEQSELTAIFTH